ncbi:hypothetical protein RCL_jg2.t1 [Rhizophagus clarus]|uniref:Uncharacterized protein n=1 Tax=Rhizophagus clarus TaxID=94130 RepID=A0A8H3QMP2_9GLOM|nr:hypothetical protein RCL_jg2.t1 [Rhizophagus clarus]
MDLVVAGVTLVLASLLPQSTAGMHEIMHCFVDLPSSWRWMFSSIKALWRWCEGLAKGISEDSEDYNDDFSLDESVGDYNSDSSLDEFVCEVNSEKKLGKDDDQVQDKKIIKKQTREQKGFLTNRFLTLMTSPLMVLKITDSSLLLMYKILCQAMLSIFYNEIMLCLSILQLKHSMKEVSGMGTSRQNEESELRSVVKSLSNVV